MAKLKKFSAYRNLERPYTRISKFRKKSFIRSTPPSKIARFESGDVNKKFEYKVNLMSKEALQIRHNAIEAGRQTCNRLLEKMLGKNGYFFKIRIYPHHILRENPLAAGAGADRMSTGMKKSFGKAIGSAAQVKIGQVLATVSLDKQGIKVGKEALKKMGHKMPCSCRIEAVEA
ncbi:50S ribosomal protein L16 [Candidatus Woesearchaeota archaeon]|nr:50S ribosomal protein L16 [Candidatus Woesearchaeota archaeon]